MRITILGDFHQKDNELELTEKAMEDISNCSSDLVVPLGDFGSNDKIGSPDGLRQAYRYISSLNSKIRPILGNHDLERESGRDVKEQGVIVKEFKKIYGLDQPYGILEYDDFRLLFISTDPQPEDSCYEVQECYVSDEQYSWVLDALSKRRGVPVIVFSHAPPVGCGLRTVPDVHVRATNAYLDQNHNPDRWLELVRSHKEIVMWFSAHYHLSHQYEDSQTNNYGTTFFITGVHGSATRDHKRQSRVLDISSDKLTVSTLDHKQRSILSTPDWSYDGSLKKKMKAKYNIINSSKKSTQQFALNQTNRSACMIKSCSVGNVEQPPIKILPFEEDKFLIATNDGYLWELDVDANAVLGTHHMGDNLSAFTYRDGIVWRAWDEYIIPTDSTTPWRFVRRLTENIPTHYIPTTLPVQTIIPCPTGGVWFGRGKSIYWVDSNIKSELNYQFLKPVLTLNEDIVEMKTDDNHVLLSTVNGNVYRLDTDMSKSELLLTDVISWDFYQNRLVALLDKQVICILTFDGELSTSETIEVNFAIGNKVTSSLLCLDEGKFVFVFEGKAMLWLNHHNEWFQLDTNNKKVVSLTRGLKAHEFCLGLDMLNSNDQPQLQIWEF